MGPYNYKPKTYKFRFKFLKCTNPDVIPLVSSQDLYAELKLFYMRVSIFKCITVFHMFTTEVFI